MRYTVKVARVIANTHVDSPAGSKDALTLVMLPVRRLVPGGPLRYVVVADGGVKDPGPTGASRHPLPPAGEGCQVPRLIALSRCGRGGWPRRAGPGEGPDFGLTP